MKRIRTKPVHWAASLALLATACASGEPTTQAAPEKPVKVASAKAPKAAKDPNALVCKNKKEIGSNMPVRTCLTQAQWDARNTLAKEASDEIGRTLKDQNNACGSDPRC